MFSPTLLISDDDDAFRETLRDMFEPEGFRTVLAEDGLEALEIMTASDIDIALLDMHMPRLDGLEAIRQAKIIKPKLPCILLSAALDDMMVRYAQELLVFSTLAKPCSKTVLTSTVRMALLRQ